MTGLITVNQHSSIRIAAEKVVYIDPFRIASEPHDADVILFTHDHYDHFSPEDAAKVCRDDTVFAAPASMTDALAKAGFNENRITLLRPGDITAVGGVPVEAVPAYNKLKPFHPKRNGWLGYVITADHKRIYVCGDTDDVPEIRNVKCDIICVPIGGFYTMDAKQAAALVNAVKPAAAVPVHYGTVAGRPEDADIFKKFVGDDISVSIKLSF